MRFPPIKKYFKYNYDKNIVELFKPLYILLSLVGLFPYTIEFPKGQLDTRIIQKPLVFHVVGAMLLIAFLCYYFIIEKIFNITATDRSVGNITYTIEIFVYMLIDIVIYFCAFQNAKKYIQILRDIACCWANLSQVNMDAVLMYLQKLLVLPAIAWLVIFSSVQTALCNIGTLSVSNQLLFMALPAAASSLVIAFYSSLVLLVVGLLKNIEQHCEMVGTKRDVNSAKINSVETNVCTIERADTIQLFELERAYVTVLEIKQDINDAFQAPISLIIIHCFDSLLTDAHALYREVVVTQQFNAYQVLDLSYWVIHMLFVKIYPLTFTGTLLKNEAIKIGQTLHNIPTENQDNRLLMEVQHFATLMSFRKPIITIYDYLSLESNLFFGMIATVVTYLVILVQFDSV